MINCWQLFNTPKSPDKDCLDALIYLADDYRYKVHQAGLFNYPSKKAEQHAVRTAKKKAKKEFIEAAEALKPAYGSLRVDMLKVYVAYKVGINLRGPFALGFPQQRV